jgi:hypothetical protein
MVMCNLINMSRQSKIPFHVVNKFKENKRAIKWMMYIWKKTHEHKYSTNNEVRG